MTENSDQAVSSPAFVPENLMSVMQASEALGKSYVTIYRWLEKGTIKGIAIAGVQFVYKSEVDRLKNGQGSEAAEE